MENLFFVIAIIVGLSAAVNAQTSESTGFNPLFYITMAFTGISARSTFAGVLFSLDFFK